MRANGDAVRRLTDDPGSELDPTWSPSGKRMAFHYVTPGLEHGIGKVHVDRPGRTVVLRNDGTECDGTYAPDWSPRGDVILVGDVSCDAGLGAISVIDARTGDDVSGGADCFYGCSAVSHAPDGRSYGYDPDNGYSLIAVERYRAGTVFLTRSEHWSAQQPSYSPDGRLIAFTGRWLRGDRTGPQGIYTMRAADGRRKTIVVRDGSMPDWQPLP